MQCTFQKLSAGASTKSLLHPMGICCSSTADPVDDTEVTLQERILPVVPPVSEVPSPQQGGAKPARESPQVGGASSNGRPTASVDDREVTLPKQIPLVVPPVAAVPSRLPSQSGTRPARESPRVGGVSPNERPTASMDDREVQKRVPLVVPPVAAVLSRLPSQQSGTRPARGSPEVGGASSNERPTANADDRDVTSQKQIPLVLPVTAVPSRLPSQSGTKPARDSPQVGGGSWNGRPMANVDDREVTLQEHIPLVVPPVAAVPSRLPSQQSGTRPARESRQVGGASSYDRPTVNVDNRDVTSQKQIPLVLPVTAVPSRLPSQRSGTKPARDSPQVGRASSYERPTVNVHDRSNITKADPAGRTTSRGST